MWAGKKLKINMNSSFTPGDQCCGAVIFWAAPEFRELEAVSGQIGATPDPAPKADRHCNTAVPVCYVFKQKQVKESRFIGPAVPSY